MCFESWEVSEVATQLKKLPKEGLQDPFVFSSLHKCVCPSVIVSLCVLRIACRFLPPSHGDFVPVHVSEDGNFSSPKAKKALEAGSPPVHPRLSFHACGISACA